MTFSPLLAATEWTTTVYAFLCTLHFLEFAIWGAWFVVLGNILDARGFTRTQIGRIYGTMGIGSIISPMFIGAIADKYFATQIVIGSLHLIGALLLFTMAKVRKPSTFYWVALLYALAYAPTITLAYGIVFANLPSVDGAAEKYFPLIRVFGTIGWIVAGLSLKLLLKKGEPVNERPIQLAAVLSVVLGLFAFALLHTPPAGDSAMRASFQAAAGEGAETAARSGVESALTTAGMTLSADELDSEWSQFDKDNSDSLNYEEFSGLMEKVTPNLMESITALIQQLPVFLIVTFVCSMAMACYFAFAALFVEKQGVKSENVGPLMTVGQWIEIIFMLSLPWFLSTFGMNTVLAVGCGAWLLRFVLFSSAGPLGFVIFGIAIHGICFDFFFGAGAIHMENEAPTAIRNSAQSLYGVLVYGLGMFIGTELSGWLNQFCTRETTNEDGTVTRETNWRQFWLIPAVVMGIAFAFLMYSLFVRPSAAEPNGEEPSAAVERVEPSVTVLIDSEDALLRL